MSKAIFGLALFIENYFCARPYVREPIATYSDIYAAATTAASSRFLAVARLGLCVHRGEIDYKRERERRTPLSSRSAAPTRRAALSFLCRARRDFSKGGGVEV